MTRASCTLPTRYTVSRVTVTVGGATVLEASGDQLARIAALQGCNGLDGSLICDCDLGAGLRLTVDCRPVPSLWQRLRRRLLGRS